MAKQGIALREWSISASDYSTEEAFRQAVVNELASFEHIGERLGVGLVAVPARVRLDTGSYYTAEWLFKTATVPSASHGVSETQALEDALAEPALVDDADRLAEVE